MSGRPSDLWPAACGGSLGHACLGAFGPLWGVFPTLVGIIFLAQSASGALTPRATVLAVGVAALLLGLLLGVPGAVVWACFYEAPRGPAPRSAAAARARADARSAEQASDDRREAAAAWLASRRCCGCFGGGDDGGARSVRGGAPSAPESACPAAVVVSTGGPADGGPADGGPADGGPAPPRDKALVAAVVVGPPSVFDGDNS